MTERNEANTTEIGAEKFEGVLNEARKLSFDELWEVVRILRSENGCPWDKVQTHESLEKPMIEEAYETVDAIEKGDPEKLCEELGDVLLQVIFHTQISEDSGDFSLLDVTDREARKMISRHPFLFEEHKVLDEEPKGSWEAQKLKEKGISTLKEDIGDIPAGYPAITRAIKISQKIRRAKESGDEEVAKFDDGSEIPDELKDINFESEEEIGKLLYTICAKSWSRGTDPDRALRRYADNIAGKITNPCDKEEIGKQKHEN